MMESWTELSGLKRVHSTDIGDCIIYTLPWYKVSALMGRIAGYSILEKSPYMVTFTKDLESVTRYIVVLVP